MDPSYGGAYTNFHGLVPRISEAAPYMREALAVGRRGGTKDFVARYVPLCHFPDDLEQISTAFGSDVARTVTETWRAGVRLYAPSNALVADDGPTGLLVGTVVDAPQGARRVAGAIYRGLFEDLGNVGGGVIPNDSYNFSGLILNCRESYRISSAFNRSTIACAASAFSNGMNV